MTEADHIARLLEAGRRAVDPKHRADPGEVGLRKGWTAGEAPQLSVEGPPDASKAPAAIGQPPTPQRAS